MGDGVLVLCEEDCCTFHIEGDLMYDKVEDFHRALNATGGIKKFEIDFSKVTKFDSSGAGLLLLLRNHVDKDSSISIINTSKEMKKRLLLLNLQEYFNIT